MTKILVICSGYPTKSHPYRNIFIKEQIDSIKSIDPSFNFEFIFTNPNRKKSDYLRAIFKIKSIAKRRQYDLIHAYYGLSAFSAIWQKEIPVLVTYTGCDINAWYNRLYAKNFILPSSAYNIFVNNKQRHLVNNPANSKVIPWGIDFSHFYPIYKNIARANLNLAKDKIYILFSSSYSRKEKNAFLAKKALRLFNNTYIEMIEFKNRTREECLYLFNAADVLLMTSIREGSPQVIKEAMACNLPIVSTDVGDVKEVIDNTEGCYLTSFHPQSVAEKIQLALKFGKKTNGRENIKNLDIKNIARKVIAVYEFILN